jgi:hypothetical protein
MDIALCIDKLLPAAQYGGVPGTTEEEYNTLRWEDERTKPTWQAIQDAWVLVQVDLAKDIIREQLADLDKYMPRPVEDSYVILTSTGNIAIVDLGSITVAENTTLLDIYNQKVTLRSQLAS